MDQDLSSEGLLNFLREAALAGRMTPATARTRRAAAEALFVKLTPDEAADLEQLEVDALLARFRDSPDTELRSEVIDLYGRRLSEALSDYFRFLESPDNFVSDAARSSAPARRDPRAAKSAEERALESVRLSAARQRPDIVPVPLGVDRVVYLQGVPADLSAAEAQKISRVVLALADSADDGAGQ